MDNETALAIPEPAAPLALFGTTDPGLVIERASQVATVLAKIVNERKLYAIVQGRKFPTVEGWTMLGGMLGVFAHTEWTQPILDEGGKVRGYKARVVARTLSGVEVGAAEAMCMRGESAQWGENAKDYALLSMAQTRATSKAMGNPLRWVFKLAGYEGASSEEMDGARTDSDGVIANPSQESVDALRTAQVAQGSPPAAIQPVSPSSGPTPTSEANTTSPSVNPGRSVGPRPKRQNVVTAPQAQPAPSVAPAAAVGAPEPLDAPLDGKDEYMATLRQQARSVAALVVHLRILLSNKKNAQAIALGTATALALTPLMPHTESDQSLTTFIATKFPGQTLDSLSETDLASVISTLEEIVERIHKSGTHE